jgi:hypothetical protein
MSVPQNLQVGTLNENDFSTLRTWYNEDEKKNKMEYGLSLDAKMLENYMISVAF